MDKLLPKEDEFMDKNKQQNNDNGLDAVEPKSILLPPTQPLPKKTDKKSTNAVQNGSTKDSDPTM